MAAAAAEAAMAVAGVAAAVMVVVALVAAAAVMVAEVGAKRVQEWQAQEACVFAPRVRRTLGQCH